MSGGKSSLDIALQRMHERGLKLRGVAIPWFTAETWPRLLEIAADRSDLPATFEQFELRAGERFDRHVAAGRPLEKVVIGPDELAGWCHEYGVPVDARSRAVFAAYKLMQRDQHAGNA